MLITEQIKNAGVVGAGGAGFPTHVKLNVTAETVIANGAECEPLLRVDQLLMSNYAERVVSGLVAAMSAVNAATGVIATKTHYHDAVKALELAIKDKPGIRVHLMKSYYPAGDEKSLIHEVTGRVVPSAKLPVDTGCVVSNVATLMNIANAIDGKAVTDKYLTIGGDVKNPVTLCAPVGVSIRELLELAGVKGSEREYTLIVGGPCMGKVEENWDASITKTTGGLLLFEKNHPLIAKRALPLSRQLKLAQAVCCQCNQCTLICPRNALGLNVQPHKVMRAAANSDARLIGDPNAVLACCSCGLCTDYACNMGLTPSVIMAKFKDELAKAGVRPSAEESIRVDEDIRLKRVPTSRLIARMGLSQFDVAAPLTEVKIRPGKVKIPLSMHVGKPSEPVVKTGDSVKRGELIAKIPEKALGACVHASINGRVTQINDSFIEITSEGG